MITKDDIGKWVVYWDKGLKIPEIGKIKGMASTPDNVFVVYNCDDNWDKFEDYTGACSDVSCLTIIGGQ